MALTRSTKAHSIPEMSEEEAKITVLSPVNFSELLRDISNEVCPLCNINLYISSWKIVEDLVNISVRCDGCCSKQLRTVKQASSDTIAEKSAKETCVTVFSILAFPGILASSALKLTKSLGIEVSTSTAFRLMDRVLAACELVARRSFVNACDLAMDLVAKGEIPGIALAGDGAWNHPRSGTGHAYTVMVVNQHDSLNNLIIYEYILQKERNRLGCKVNAGTHEGSPKSMEGAACEEVLKHLENIGLLKSVMWIVSDQDSSVGMIYQRFLPTAEQLHDPGHIKKNFKKSLDIIFGKGKDYKGMAERMGRFLMRIIKRAEPYIKSLDDRKDAITIFLHWIDHLIPHYQRDKCPSDCPCHENMDAGYKNPLTEPSKKCLPPIKPEDETKRAKNNRRKLKQLKELVDGLKGIAFKFIHGLNTCSNESLNYKRTLYAPKAVEFWKSFPGRSAINAGTHNLGHKKFWSQVIAEVNVNSEWLENFMKEVTEMDKDREQNRERKRSRSYAIREAELKRQHSLKKRTSILSDLNTGYTYASAQPLKLDASAQPKSNTPAFPCDLAGCNTVCNSIRGLKIHKTKVHNPKDE